MLKINYGNILKITCKLDTFRNLDDMYYIWTFAYSLDTPCLKNTPFWIHDSVLLTEQLYIYFSYPKSGHSFDRPLSDWPHAAGAPYERQWVD